MMQFLLFFSEKIANFGAIILCYYSKLNLNTFALICCIEKDFLLRKSIQVEF